MFVEKKEGKIKGIFFTDNNKEVPEEIHLSDLIKVVARTRDENGKDWGLLVEFKDKDGNEKKMALPSRMFAGDCTELRERLLDEGLYINTALKARNLFNTYLNTCNPSARALATSKTGWHGDTFVFPTQVVGNKAEEEIYFQREGFTNPYKQKGTLKGWRDTIGAYCVGNPRLIFSTSCAFASLLLKVLDMESGGFHIQGDSSTGKSTALKVAASVFGSPADYVHTWRATDNGLEGMASAHNDTLFILDELGQVDPNRAGEIAYMLANGSGKARANKHGAARPSYSWRLLFLSSGEIDLATHLSEGKRKIRAGQEIRLLTIPAVADNAKYGAFENIYDAADGNAFVQVLLKAAQDNYGTAGIAFLEAIRGKEESAVKLWGHTLEQYKDCIKGEDSQVSRAFNRFLLVGFAGEIASSESITGWQEGVAMDAALACFKDWRARRGSGNMETLQILAKVKRFFENNSDSRFRARQGDDLRVINNMAGYRELVGAEEDKGWRYYVLTETFKGEVVAGFDLRRANKVLLEAGWLEGGKDKSSQLMTLGGVKQRVYVFNSKLWEWENGSAPAGENTNIPQKQCS